MRTERSARPEEKIRQILTWIGVSHQLLVTRLNRLLKDTGLPFAQFVMLNHFGAFPGESWTVTRLAGAFETGQPGLSKTLHRLVDKGYLRVEPDPKDGRVKRHTLTPKGKGIYQEALLRLAPEAGLIFAGWSGEDLEAFHAALFRIKTWLDENRETRPQGAASTAPPSSLQP